MVAAHPADLNGARRVGFRTAHISRPGEFGPLGDSGRAMSAARAHAFDYYAHDLIELARQLDAL